MRMQRTPLQVVELSQQVRQVAEALGLEYEVVHAGTDAALFAELVAASYRESFGLPLATGRETFGTLSLSGGPDFSIQDLEIRYIKRLQYLTRHTHSSFARVGWLSKRCWNIR